MSDTSDLFRQTFPVTDQKHRDQLMVLTGMRMVIEAMKATKTALPGMTMAIAVAEGLAAQEQVTLSGMTYRAAAKAGADLSAVAAIYTRVADGSSELVMTIESEGTAS